MITHRNEGGEPSHAAADHALLGRPVRPAPGEPGTYGEQFAAAWLSVYLGRRRRTSAAAEWGDARRLVIPHAREGKR